MNRLIFIFFFIILHLVCGLDDCFNVKNYAVQDGTILTIEIDDVSSLFE